MMILKLFSVFLVGWVICEPDTSRVQQRASKYEPGVLEAAIVEFSLDLLKKPALCSWNCVFSPFSINSVVGLLLAGTKEGGETEQEILSAIHLTGVSRAQVQEWHSEHLEAVNNANSDKVELLSGNNIFVNDLFKLNPEFQAIAKQIYSVTPEAISFNDPNGAANKVNKWVSKNTQNMIQDILSPSAVSPNTAAVLANAIYFKGEWATKFDKALTTPQSKFFVDKNGYVEVDMMHVEDEFCHKRMTSPKFDVIELPYSGNDISMVILKPYAPLNEAISEVTATDLLVNFLQFDTCEPVSLYLPKFSIDLKVDLRIALKALNVTRLFEPNTAELDALIDTTNCDGKLSEGNKECRSLYISQAMHEAKIEVDESGTTAAAATIAVVQFENAVLSDVPEYRIDTPFFFMLYHKATKNILFMGQVVNPIGEE